MIDIDIDVKDLLRLSPNITIQREREYLGFKRWHQQKT